MREYIFAEADQGSNKTKDMRALSISGMTPKFQMEQADRNDNNEGFGNLQDQKDDYDLRGLGDLMLSGSASSSASSTQSNEFLEIKRFIDIQAMPPALLNMRRAIVIFFLTLIASSLSVLAVTLVSHQSF